MTIMDPGIPEGTATVFTWLADNALGGANKALGWGLGARQLDRGEIRLILGVRNLKPLLFRPRVIRRSLPAKPSGPQPACASRS